MKKVFAALILLSALIACASCAHFRGKVNGYYIPGDLKNFTSCRCESEGKEFEVQKKDNYLLVKTDDQTYLLSSGGGALKSEEGITKLSKEQASSALISAVTESGLIYSAAEKDIYIMTDTSGKYRADAEKFFFAAEKMRHMLKGGREEGFEKLFYEEIAAQFGDFDDHKITLDCSTHGEMKLTIENERRNIKKEYLFKDFGEVEVDITEDMREYSLLYA